MFLVIILLILICCIYLLRNTRLEHRYRNLPPMYPGLLPIVGHSLNLISYGDKTHMWNLVKETSDVVTNNGGIMTTSIAGSLQFVVTDPTYCETIANECSEKGFIYEFVKPWLGDGLATGSGEVWKRHRKLLNPAFSQQVLNSFIDIFNLQSKQLIKYLEPHAGKGPFSHIDYLEETSLENVYQTAIGINSEEYNIKNKTEYLNTVKEMFSIVINRYQTFWLHNEFIYKWSNLKRRQDTSVSITKDMFIEVIEAKKATEKRSGSRTDVKYKAFMDLLLEHSADGSLSNEEIWDEVNTILVAGQETSATTLVYIFILLGSHPAIQDKVYKELKEVFGSSFRDVDKMDLVKLVYLEAVIKETLRLYPIGSAIIRRITQDVKLDKYTLPAGSGCIFMIYGLHRHPVWSADADKFRPERWLGPSPAPRNAFAGFGLGKRYCIGKTYAIMFIKTALVHVLRHYRITGDVTKLKLKLDVILKPHSGYFVSIDKRNG